ncbi:uncharacterized protein LOC125515531 isoform X1 [Triticum urartu]|uniref:Uncharacterized protein n=1 Tax=Triticum urartu TaxID=4572 RepID=A0A8R7QXC2_TRIUA|nr:uncharacterized protein LOC125515531 isoform X1 [Triticum urartu]
MAKPHGGAVHTPRPRSSSGAKAVTATTPANRSSVGSSSSAPPARDLAKEAGKLLTYDDDDAASAAQQQPDPALPEGLAVADLAPPLDLPDPDDDASSSTVVSVPPHDAIPAPDRSALAQVRALARFPADSASPSVENSVRAAILGSDSSDLERSRAPGVARPADPDATATVLTEMGLVLAELRGARGLSARSRCLLTALAEAAADELDPLRTRHAAFWRKLRVGVLAATVFSVAAMDAVLLAALLGGPRGSGSHALPPT